jgi:Protein of unknown function (DUF1460)
VLNNIGMAVLSFLIGFMAIHTYTSRVNKNYSLSDPGLHTKHQSSVEAQLPQISPIYINSNKTIAENINNSQPPIILTTETRKQVPTHNKPELADFSEPKDTELFNKIIQYSIQQNFYQKPYNQIIQAIAKQLLGSPYRADLLNHPGQEKLFVSLSQFDCVLFVETVLAMAKTIALKNYTYLTFENNVQDLRYVNGKINGYCSRLHYFSEWINDNQRRKNIFNITPKLSGFNIDKKLDFMSKHWTSYPQIVNNKTNKDCIAKMETKLIKFNLNYIPIYKINNIYNQLQSGDVIAIATKIDGLDVTHTGFVYINSDQNIGLIHASPNGSVRISNDLKLFVENVESAIGIIVARPIDPRSKPL